MAKVTMPQLGESVAEGTIGKWLKKPGDTVEKYEALVEVITDKVNAEVPSPFAGILKEILVEEGATVPNNAEIAIIETADEGAGTTDEPAAAGTGPTTTSPGSGAAPTPAPAPAAETAAPDDKPAPAVAAAPAAPRRFENSTTRFRLNRNCACPRVLQRVNNPCIRVGRVTTMIPGTSISRHSSSEA